MSQNQEMSTHNNSFSAPTIVGALALVTGITATTQANAALIITDINETITAGESLLLDVNGDGNNDIEFYIYAYDHSFGSGENGRIKSWNSVQVGYNSSSKDAQMFGEGDSINSSTQFGNPFRLYDNGLDATGAPFTRGDWDTIGDHGYLAFSFTEDDGVHYGFLEITRGSLTFGQLGYQTVTGQAAVIPTSTPVPEPGTMLLLTTGAIGLLAQRRRKTVSVTQA